MTHEIKDKIIEGLKTENAKLKSKLALLTPVRHPVSKTNYVPAFEIEGEKFFKWQNVEDVPTGRKIYIDGFISATNLNWSPEQRTEAWTKIIQLAANKDTKGVQLLGVEALKRIEMLPLPKMIFRLMAMLYLKQDDDIELDLPPDEIERRAELFERVKKKTLNEIFLLPMSSILGSLLFSKQDSNISSKQKDQLINLLMTQQYLADYSQKTLMEL